MNLDEAIPTDISWFREWRSPRDFSARVSDIIDCLRQREALPNGRHELFAAHKWKYLLEAWAAGNLSYILAQRGPLRVRLGEGGQKPDFYIQQHANVMPFELTECDDDQRRRGDEYLRMKAQICVAGFNIETLGTTISYLENDFLSAYARNLLNAINPRDIYVSISTSDGKPPFRSMNLRN